MSKILTILFITISISISSQEMSKEYLDSLPESVRSDVLSKIEAREEIEKPVYRRASTSIDKGKDEDEDEGEENVMDQVFGSKFFDTVQSSFMPINEPNLDSNYVLDFGDLLEVQLIGQNESINSHYINRDGSINLPSIGKLSVAGLSLQDASNLIKAKVKNIYIGTEAFITLKNIRDISVLLAGNAFNPGVYTLNGNASILHALTMAGGVDELGSYRDINLIRNGDVIDSLDIYKLLVYGEHNTSQGLRSGDSIVVNPSKILVSVESGVYRPGKYQMKENETLVDLFNFANGINRYADINSIKVKRISNGKNIILDIDFNDLDSFQILDGDSIHIKEFKHITVRISGAVANPGEYIIQRGALLSNLIDYAGGYDDSAYPFGGFLNNKQAYEINEESKQRLYNAFINNLFLNAGKLNTQSDNIGFVLEQLKQSEVSGRIIAEFDLNVLKDNPEKDTILEEGDEIFIPYITQQVFVQGEVNNPGATRYTPGQDINYYIKSVGGELKKADLKNIFVIHPNGETTNLNKYSNTLSFVKGQTDRQLIYPGSIIYVPQTTNLANPLEAASIWAPIISSIALSLTSLSVLNNNN